MKKSLSIIMVFATLFTLLAFTSCNNKEDDKDVVKIQTLSGTTAFSIAKLWADNDANLTKNNYQIEIATDPVAVRDAVIAGDIDIAALPTNVASIAYNMSNGKVQILAINTLGVLHLLDKTGSVQTLADLEGKTIYVPAQNPTIVLKCILKANNINATVSNDYASPDALQTAVEGGKVDIAVLPEPKITIVTTKNPDYKRVIDLTEEWEKIPNAKPLVQGCVVVNKEFAQKNPEAVKNFLEEYKNSINYLNTNTQEAVEHIANYNILPAKPVATKAIPNCNFAYMDGEEMKSAMSGFLNSVKEINIQFIGGKIPADDFYYIP